MKIKKEVVSKKKVAPKKKMTAKVRSVSLAKKNNKKVEATATKKRVTKKNKTIASLKVGHKKASNKFSSVRMVYRLKRLTYMLLSVIMGLLVAGFLAGLLERTYLKNNFDMEVLPLAYQFLGMNLYLAPMVYIVIFAAGIGFGAWVGFWGWRMVYIEHRHRMFQKK